MVKKSNKLKLMFDFIKKHKRIILIITILLFTSLLLLDYVKAVFYSIIFIGISSVSKTYQRIIKSSIGIDLVLFSTLMISLAYHNIVLTFLVSYISLILADIIGTKLSHTSLVSLIGLTIIIFVSSFNFGLNIMYTMILLSLVYSIITSLLYYYMLGSSPQRISLYFFSQIIFNLIIIINLSIPINNLIV
jgi:hypothetical protein